MAEWLERGKDAQPVMDLFIRQETRTAQILMKAQSFAPNIH